MGLTATELAVRVGRSEQAVVKAEKAHRIVRGADGTFDESQIEAFERNRRNRPGPGRPRRASADAPSTENLPGGGKPTLWDLQAVHEEVKIAERRLKLRRERGKLVAWAPFRREIFEFVRRERDVWLTWPARVAAKLAAEFSLEMGPLQIALEREIRAQLIDLARRMPLETAPKRPVAAAGTPDEGGEQSIG